MIQGLYRNQTHETNGTTCFCLFQGPDHLEYKIDSLPDLFFISLQWRKRIIFHGPDPLCFYQFVLLLLPFTSPTLSTLRCKLFHPPTRSGRSVGIFPTPLDTIPI